MIEKVERFKCFNAHFRLLKIVYVHLLVCYLNKIQNAPCNEKYSFCFPVLITFLYKLYKFMKSISFELLSMILSASLSYGF